MKAIWVDHGNDAAYHKLEALGINEVYYDIRDPRINKPYLTNVRNLGFTPGVYSAWAWPETNDLSGVQFAEWTHAELNRVAPSTGNNFPRVHLNIETHDVGYIVSALKRWRQLRPSRWTLWTMEGHQGGLFDTTAIAAIEATGVLYGPQAYTGDMRRFESDRVALDLAIRGFDVTRIFCFYDAAQLGQWWDGVLYTQGRLP